MNTFFSKLKVLVAAHKFIAVVIVIVLVAGGYYAFKNFSPKGPTYKYVTEIAEKATISVSISGSGQVSELNSIDLKPLTSGALTSVSVKKGDQVKTGQVIAVIDQRDAIVSINQAKASLANAQANYDTVKIGATTEDIRISQNSVKQAENSYNNALVSQQNSIKTTATNIAQAQNTLDDLKDFTGQASPTNKRGLAITAIDDKLSVARNALDAENKIFNDTIFMSVFGNLDSSKANSARDSYGQALIYLNSANSSLSNVKAYRSDANVDQAVNDAVIALNKAQLSLNYCYNALQSTVPGTGVSQSSIDSFKSSINSQISNINAGITAIQTAAQALKDAMVAAQNALDSAKLTSDQQLASAKSQVESSLNSWQTSKEQLAKLTAPATKQEIDSAAASVYSARVQYQQAVDQYKDTTIIAPFDGLIASAVPQKGDQVSASTIIATLITNQYVAIVPLNEVDVAKIKMGNQVVMTFDAIDSLSLTGKVIDIDTLGTVAQGVVTYNVKISFDAQDPAVKPGMSTNVSIITNVKTDVLAAPNAAVKTQNGASYVQTLDASGKPQNVPVQIGIANDSYTEIISGLKEGDAVVTQTINLATAAKTAPTSAGIGSILGGGGANRGASFGGAARGN